MLISGLENVKKGLRHAAQNNMKDFTEESWIRISHGQKSQISLESKIVSHNNVESLDDMSFLQFVLVFKLISFLTFNVI